MLNLSTGWPFHLFKTSCWLQNKSSVLARPGQVRPKRNFCFEVNRRFWTSGMVTLYIKGCVNTTILTIPVPIVNLVAYLWHSSRMRTARWPSPSLRREPEMCCCWQSWSCTRLKSHLFYLVSRTSRSSVMSRVLGWLSWTDYFHKEIQ